MKIKVCGLTTLEQVYALESLDVHYAGFIFYPPSPRFAGIHGLTGTEVKKARVKMYKVGVFVNAGYDEIMRRIEEYGLDMVQLHGHETPFECSRLLPQIDVIKAFRFAENDHVFWTIKDFYEHSDYFLMDTGVPAAREERENKALHGGIGRRFSWNRLRNLDIQKPFFLSGGIAPGDIDAVRAFLQNGVAKDAVAVDLSSRFESAPGIKDIDRVHHFIRQLREPLPPAGNGFLD